MAKFCQQVTPWLWDTLLVVLAGPTYAVLGAGRLTRRIRFARTAARRALACRTCGRQMLLVGFWKCACGFTYRGHLLRLCPICRTLPQVIRCEHCGATEKVSV